MAAVKITESGAEVPEQLEGIVCAPEAQPPQCVKKTKEGIQCSYSTTKEGMHCLIYCKFHSNHHVKEFFKEQARFRQEIEVTYEAMRQGQVRRARMDLALRHTLAATSGKYDDEMQGLTRQLVEINPFRDARRLGFSSSIAGFLSHVQPVRVEPRAVLHPAPAYPATPSSDAPAASSHAHARAPPLPPRRYTGPVIEELDDEDQVPFRSLEDDPE